METVLYSQMFYVIFQFCAFESLDGNIASESFCEADSSVDSKLLKVFLFYFSPISTAFYENNNIFLLQTRVIACLK